MLKTAKAWQILSAAVAIILLIEGLAILIIAAPTTISGFGEISESDLQLFGLVLLLIGVVCLAFSLLYILRPQYFEEGSRIAIIARLIKVFGGIAIATEGLVLATISGKMTIEGVGTFEAYVVAVFAGQIFFLGLGLLLLEALSNVEFKLSRLLVYFGGLVAASEGVVVIGIADDTFIEGLGYIMESTVQNAGVQLLIIGIVFLFCCLMIDRSGPRLRAFSALRMVTGSLIIIEGLAITVLATNVTPEFIGTITTRTIIIAGIQLAIFGGIALLLAGIPSMSISKRWGKLSSMASVFLLLLIPAAYLTVGMFWGTFW